MHHGRWHCSGRQWRNSGGVFFWCDTLKTLFVGPCLHPVLVTGLLFCLSHSRQISHTRHSRDFLIQVLFALFMINTFAHAPSGTLQVRQRINIQQSNTSVPHVFRGHELEFSTWVRCGFSKGCLRGQVVHQGQRLDEDCGLHAVPDELDFQMTMLAEVKQTVH